MTYGVPRTLGRNAVVTICAFLVGYGVLTLAIVAEMNFSKLGEARPSESSPPSTVNESEAVFDSMEASLNRFRFVYHPLALLLPALVIARFSRAWEWSWLITALGCSFSLLAVVFAFSNLGQGQIFGLLIYILVAALVTLTVYSRERKEDVSPNKSFQADPDPRERGSGPLNSSRQVHRKMKSMKYSVEHKGHIIGHADLEVADAGMNVLAGRFVASAKQYEIQHVFRLFADERYEEYYEARDALGLRLLDSASNHVPTSFIHIVDFSAESGPEAMQLEANPLVLAQEGEPASEQNQAQQREP